MRTIIIMVAMLLSSILATAATADTTLSIGSKFHGAGVKAFDITSGQALIQTTSGEYIVPVADNAIIQKEVIISCVTIRNGYVISASGTTPMWVQRVVVAIAVIVIAIVVIRILQMAKS